MNISGDKEVLLAKALGEPVGFDLSDAASKIKRNLLLVSLVIIILVLGELKTSDKLSIFGVSLEGVTPEKLMLGLGFVLLYSAMHFSWYCFDALGEWYVRVTGTRLAYITGARYADKVCDYPDDPKQSTLYTWWLKEARTAFRFRELMDDLGPQIEEVNRRIDDIDAGRNPSGNGAMAATAINMLNGTVLKFNSHLENYGRIVGEDRIPFSLKRFDRRFHLLLRSQNLRVLLVDVIVPFLVAFYAAVLLGAYFNWVWPQIH
ncbi:MAG: hypothetical protein QM805_05835 [Pseudomonas sp.]